MPRPGHSRKNPDAESFQNSVAEKLECLGVESGGRVKVWFMDEARLGLHAEMRRVWALRGKRPVVTRHQIPVGIPMRRAERSKRGGRCGCRADDKRAASDPSYRRALWIVVVLNLSFGLVEIIGGFFARSQALKADALDFLGDGSITLVGLFALAWAERIRARVALTQRCFLAALGLGVIGAAIWRSMNAVAPEADLMGGLGIAGLLVNVSAALVLLRFRDGGDANARAIWLFSRNDALANVAVIIAAALVAWLKTAWPDLLVAAIIALLFLHAAWEIIWDSLAELRERHSA